MTATTCLPPTRARTSSSSRSLVAASSSSAIRRSARAPSPSGAHNGRVRTSSAAAQGRLHSRGSPTPWPPSHPSAAATGRARPAIGRRHPGIYGDSGVELRHEERRHDLGEHHQDRRRLDSPRLCIQPRPPGHRHDHRDVLLTERSREGAHVRALPPSPGAPKARRLGFSRLTNTRSRSIKTAAPPDHASVPKRARDQRD